MHDKNAVAQSTNTSQSGTSGAGASNAYLTVPGTGEAPAATINSGGTAGVYVPLTDALGSTLALVNAAGGVAAQYAYDPFGNATASGQSLPYPYQYAGMELDQTGLYFNGRGYYSPALGRPLEGYGAPNAPGGGKGGGGSQPSSSGGGGGGFNFAASAENGAAQYAISQAAADAVQGIVNAAYVALYGVETGIPVVGPAVALVTAIVQAVLDLFGISIFGGGGSRPTPPPMDYRFFHYPSGPLLGVLPCLAPNMYDSAAVEAAAIFAPPFAALSDNPPSLTGNPYGDHIERVQYSSPPGACSQYDAECGKSGDADQYACHAGPCCRAFGDNPTANCTRGCLLQHEASCFGSSSASACRAEAHISCYVQCLQNPFEFLGYPACRALGSQLLP